MAESNSGEKIKAKTDPKPHSERKIVIDFGLNSKDGKIDQEESFSLQWQSNKSWKPGTYYKIVADADQDLFTTRRSAVFSGALGITTKVKKL